MNVHTRNPLPIAMLRPTVVFKPHRTFAISDLLHSSEGAITGTGVGEGVIDFAGDGESEVGEGVVCGTDGDGETSSSIGELTPRILDVVIDEQSRPQFPFNSEIKFVIRALASPSAAALLFISFKPLNTSVATF